MEDKSSVLNFISLMKPRVMMLVVFSGYAGMKISPVDLHPFYQFITILSIALASGSAGAFNMWYERESDKLMKRTRYRPLPLGKITPSDAFMFSFTTGVFSIILLALATNLIAAALLLISILFYSIIYTIILKPNTPYNIVIGGAAGAFPPIIGWAATTGQISFEPIILFLIIFFWTPPHFWSLALIKSEDYNKANIPMLPNVIGAHQTRKQIFIYTLILTFISILPFTYNMSGKFYLIGSIILNIVFIGISAVMYIKKSNKLAMKNFSFSIAYLFIIILLLIIDQIR